MATSLHGGAGIAALNMHKELRRIKVDSQLFTLRKGGINALEPGIKYVQRNFLSKVAGPPISSYSGKNSGDYFFSPVSIPAISTEKLMQDLGAKSSLIHLHNWFNFTSLSQISKITNIFKIVVSLHDERFFTGGCHHTLECLGFMNTCSDCRFVNPMMSRAVKKSWLNSSTMELSNHSKYLFLAPSRWIEAEARKSSLLKDSQIIYFPNLFPKPALNGKSENSFKTNKVLKIGIASVDPFAYIKGGEIVRKLANYQIENPNTFEFVFMKDFAQDNKDSFWNGIDCIFVPSVADNSPNVIHEAKIHGVQVAASERGGIPELLNSHFDYEFIYEEFSISEFLTWLSTTNSRRSEVREDYENRIATHPEQLRKIYLDFLK